MKKLLLIFLSVILLFSACVAEEEEGFYSDYTAQMMIDEIKAFYSVDVSNIVAEYDVEKMKASQKEELMIYLANYAHYKDLSSTAFLADFEGVLSTETYNTLSEILKEENFEGLDVDSKIALAEKLYAEWYFYDYSEKEAQEVVSSILNLDSTQTLDFMRKKGYFDTDKNGKSKILYEIIVLDEIN